MVSHPNSVKPGTVQYQSCHCWTLINFWWVSPPSYGSKCSPPHDSDLKAPKTCSVPSQLPGKPRLVSTFSTPQELVISQLIQAASVRVLLAANVESTASLKNLQHRNHPCMSLTHCIFHWQPRAARTLLCTGAASHLSSCYSERLWMTRDRAWLSPGRRQGRKNLPAPTPRLLHILLSWMTAWCNCHIDNPSNMEGFSSWSREVANGDVSSEMTMHLKTSRASASLWIFFFFF